MEVHNKEVTEGLCHYNITDITSFEWIKHLRYVWEKPADKSDMST